MRYWSDYNRVFYHPRSVVQLNEYELNSQVMPFEDWDVGGELFNDLDKEHDLLDRDLRPFAEECDQMRAIQLFAGSDDAWGGFAARYIDRLRDEYGKKSIWIWAIEDGTRVQRVSLDIHYNYKQERHAYLDYSTTNPRGTQIRRSRCTRFRPRQTSMCHWSIFRRNSRATSA